jgi:hypothetical protein
MTADVKSTLAAQDGPYALSDVASGRVGLLDVHYESFVSPRPLVMGWAAAIECR